MVPAQAMHKALLPLSIQRQGPGIGGREQLVLGVAASRERLACQARVREDIRIEIIQNF